MSKKKARKNAEDKHNQKQNDSGYISLNRIYDKQDIENDYFNKKPKIKPTRPLEFGDLMYCPICDNEGELIELFNLGDGHYKCGWCHNDFYI